ncbi:MAG: IS1595 family transposase, partial [Desulfovibrio sp.]|nr:IS1595 family transposase [Desulfovibrio sp.]
MYERRSRLNSRQQAELIKFFVAGTTARAAGEIAGGNRNTAASYFMRLRRLIAMHLPSYHLSGEVEADESYFGGVRKGKRGRGAAGRIAVFGLLKRNGKVYTAIIPNARTETLMPIIEERVEPDSIVYTDMFWAYNALDVSDFHHHRIDH